MSTGDLYGDRTPTDHERRAGRPWDDSYRERCAPWDIGRPQAAVVRLAEQGGFAGSVLDAGCGTGEHALYLAARGCQVVGVDVARTAIDQARHKAIQRQVDASFLVADALHLGRLQRTFDCLLDVGLFHTFDDHERRAYVESLASVAHTGTVLHLLCCSDKAPGDDGPRRVSQAELRSAFGAGWVTVSIASERIEVDPAALGDDVPAWLTDGIAAWLATIERT